ncbi:MAG: O-antigen ligase family protein [Chlamydiota bacterium]
MISHLLPTPFRLFYLVLLFSPLFYRCIFVKELQLVALFIPFFAYCLLSSCLHHYQSVSVDAYPFWRCWLLVCEALFTFGAAFTLRNQKHSAINGHIIRLYLIGFSFSLLLCLIGYCGFYLGKVSLATLHNYSIEAQDAYFLLRFSPGTYPNEYGIMTSFALSILTLLCLAKKQSAPFALSPFLLCVLYGLAFIVLGLMTTRAAYLSFVLAMIYLVFSYSSFRLLAFLTLVIFFATKLFSPLFNAVRSISLTTGSSGARIAAWLQALTDFKRSPLFGSGWATQIHVHNAYFQLVVELGLIGTLLMVIALSLQWAKTRSYPKKHFFLAKKELKPFADHVIAIGLIHVLSFALTNHNINHHLTWLILLLLIHRYLTASASKRENKLGEKLKACALSSN